MFTIELQGLQPFAPQKTREEVMSSDSTSTEDEYERIKEAVDENFLTEELYTENKSNKKTESPPKSKSLRNQNHKEISNNPFSIKVTPEFQGYVSKHLSKLLDEIIDDRDIVVKNKKPKKSHLNYGIKLLGSSKDYVLFGSNDKSPKKLKKLPMKDDSDAIDYKKRAKEVAVTPEWVLSQEETKHWAPSTKGDIEIIKVDDCNKNLKRKKKKHKL